MKASLQPKPMYCSRDYYYSSRNRKCQSDMAGQIGHAGPGSSAVCHTIWNAPRNVVWSSSGAQWMSSPLLEESNLLDVSLLDMLEKNPVTPSIPTERASSPEQRSGPWRKSQLPYLPLTYKKIQNLKELPPQRISSCVEETATSTAWIYQFMGG